MLIKLTDRRGKVRWLNPIYVKSLLRKGDNDTEIDVSGIASNIRVPIAAEEVAAMIDAAMPDGAMMAAVAASEAEANEQQSTSNAAAGGAAAF